MRGLAVTMVAMLALSCMPTSYSIVSMPNLATEASLQGSVMLQGAQEEGGGRTWGAARIATPRLELRGGAETAVATKRKPYKPSAFRSSLTWTGKAIAAAFSSLLTTSAAMVTFEFTAQKIQPAMAEAGMPHGVAALVTVGAVVGSILGGYVIGRLSPSHPSLLALIVGLVFTAAQYLNLDAVQHPSWFPMAEEEAKPENLKGKAPPSAKAQTPAKTPAKTPKTAKKAGKTPGKTPKGKK